jgi:sporulation protein YlmC with PRC-barrel domain
MAKFMVAMFGAVFALGLLVTNGFADEQMAMSMGKPSALSSLSGTYVVSPKGEYLGRASNFVIDSQGHVAFVVVSHGGFLRFGEKETAVPFASFAYDREKKHFVLDSTREHLNAAPEFTKQDLYSEMWADHVYWYFGKAPYWTEGELVEKGMKPMDEATSGFDDPFFPYGYTP